jgi:hypothetical protein
MGLNVRFRETFSARPAADSGREQFKSSAGYVNTEVEVAMRHSSVVLQDPPESHCGIRERNRSQSLRAHALHTRHFNPLILRMNHSDPSWAPHINGAISYSFVGRY